ncbi:MAG: division/cell wall cluster transcriptional repressor MraZ [Oscillospiraceae bacterium]
MAFLGEFKHNIDPKNRVFIPAKYREALGESFVVCKAPEKCLFIYSNEAWDELSQEISNMPPSPQTRQIQREIFRNAVSVEPDKQGRITVNSKLVEYAGLKQEAVIVGSGKRIELWDAQEWENNLLEMEPIINDAAARMEPHY